MTTVNRLSKENSISQGDLIPVWVGSNTDVRRVTINVLAQLMKTLLGIPDSISFNTQYVSPDADFNLTLISQGINIWLIMTPTTDIGTGVITMPVVGTCLHNQEMLLVCSTAITSFSINGNGANISNVPTSLNAGDSLRYRFDSVMKTWYLTDHVTAANIPTTPQFVYESGTNGGIVPDSAGTEETIMCTIPIAVGDLGLVRISPVFSCGNLSQVTIRIRLNGEIVAGFVIDPDPNPVSTAVVSIQSLGGFWASTIFSMLGNTISRLDGAFGYTGDISGLVNGELTITGQRSVDDNNSIGVGYYTIEKQGTP